MFVFVPRSRPLLVGRPEDRAYALEMARAGHGPEEVENLLMARGLDRDTARGIVRTIGAWRRYALHRAGAVAWPLAGFAIAAGFSLGHGFLERWLGDAAYRRFGIESRWVGVATTIVLLLLAAWAIRLGRRRQRAS